MTTDSGCVRNPVRSILQFEAIAVFLALAGSYYALRASWIVFIVLLLAPDVAMLGYLRGTRLGAWSYNAAHSYVGPIALGAASLLVHALAPFAVIWAAHIAMDRALGFGLKYGDSFKHTHLGTIGRTD